MPDLQAIASLQGGIDSSYLDPQSYGNPTTGFHLMCYFYNSTANATAYVEYVYHTDGFKDCQAGSTGLPSWTPDPGGPGQYPVLSPGQEINIAYATCTDDAFIQLIVGPSQGHPATFIHPSAKQMRAVMAKLVADEAQFMVADKNLPADRFKV